MCGIAGALTLARSVDARAEIEAMTAALYHRGPDAGAVFVDESAGVALGHRRLAVVELSERGAQPMHSADGRFVFVFNGEIYNHHSLRRELEATRVVDWRGTSDTETLVECFAAWGVASTLHKAVGMFAFALWDRAERKLTLARDRFGEKPLYYGFVGCGAATIFLFGSELKALRAHRAFDQSVNRNALALYLRYSYVPTPHTIYRDTYKLEPGSILHMRPADVAARRRLITRYWRYEEVVAAGLAEPFVDECVAINALEASLSKAVGLQLMADVPVGAFLSGGIDSSTIVALMQAQSSRPVKTFTVGFDEAGFDEAPHAREVARHLRTDHCEIRVTANEARSVVPKLPTIYDEPFGDSSQIPTSIICAVARREVTVALSGDAGDEMLGGYNRYAIGPQLWRRIKVTPQSLREATGKAAAHLPEWAWSALAWAPGIGKSVAPFKDKAYKLGPALRGMQDCDDLYRALVTEWTPGAAPALSATHAATRLDDLGFAADVGEPARRMMLFDGLTYLPDDILVKVDRAAMAVSLETRVPLLDHRVAEAAWRLPPSMIIRGGRGKWALRQVLYRHVPQELVERPKAGFAIPVGQWLRGPLRDWAEELLSERRLREEGYLDAAVVRSLWAQHRSGRRDWQARLWNILMFQAWLSSVIPIRSTLWPR
jgi:asparagine synthase (glutamine-hydrolysing)